MTQFSSKEMFISKALRRHLWPGAILLFMAMLLSIGSRQVYAQVGGPGTGDRDSTALMALYNALDGDNWTIKVNWKTNPNIRQWSRIRFNSSGRVTEIILPNNNLRGQLPFEIGLLDELQVLDLRLNQITGPLPDAMNDLVRLRRLQMDDNQLTALPFRMDKMAALQEIFLQDNQIAGPIPSDLGSLSQLRTINLTNNRLTGDVPPSLLNLSELRNLQIGENDKLTNLPDFSSHPNLDVLNVSDNKFDFGDLEPNLDYFPNQALNSRYSPQDSLYEKEYINIFPNVANQTPIQLQSDARGRFDVYQWYKDGVPLRESAKVQGVNNRILTINNPTAADIGRYDCSVDNRRIEFLTLHRQPIFLEYINDDPFATSIPDRFEVDFISGCAPHMVTLTNLVDAQNVQYQIAGRPNLIRDPIAKKGSKVTVQFSEPGTFLITQFVTNSPPVNLEVRVYPPNPPEMKFVACSNNQLTVSMVDSTSVSYELLEVDFGDGSSPIRMAPHEVFSYRYARSGTYEVIAKPYLINGNTTRCLEYSEMVEIANNPPPALFEKLEIGQNEIISLQLNASPNYRYQLQYAVNGSSSFQNLNADFSDPSNIAIRGLDVRNNYYCFRVITRDECGNNDGISQTFCSIQPEVTAEHKANFITWNTDFTIAGGNLSILRDGQLIANFPANETNYLDTEVICNIFYRYRIELETPSGQRSISWGVDHLTRAFERPDSINGKAIAPSLEGIALNWDAPAIAPSWYYVYRVEGGNRTLVDSTQTNSYVERGLETSSPRVCYEITYKDDCLVESVVGPGICFSTGNNLKFPNAIMPDGPVAINREFKPIGEFFGRYALIIMNQYGQEIFRTRELTEGWDGTHNGRPVPVGTYPYKLELVNLGGKKQTFTGTVTVVR
jgi:gliding motility-associated-like protein